MKNLIEKIKEKLAASKLNMGIFLSCLLVAIICVVLLVAVISRDNAINTSIPAHETASPTDAEKKETVEKTDSTTESEHITDSETTDVTTENETSSENTSENTETPSGNGSELPAGSSAPSSTEGNSQGGNSQEGNFAGGSSAGNNPAGGNSQGGNSSGEAAQLNVNISAVNSWESNGQTYVQYNIDMTNPTGQKIAGWQLNLNFTTEITISDSWGGTLTPSGTQLNIAPVDYTNEINPWETKNLGFIIYSGSYASVSSYSVNNSGGSQGGTSQPSQGNPSGQNPGVLQPPSPPAAPVVSGFYSEHGALHVSGTSLCDKNGTPIQLKGVSTHGLSWFPEYVNADAFSSLRSFGVNTIRLALYTYEYNGYCNGGDQSALKALVKRGIQYATEQDMYVIVDWHVLNDRNPNTYIDDAVSFFNEISSQYAGQGNIIYEICNEPNGGVSWNEIKTYAERIINVIRANDANAVIIVGTPTWSQDVDAAAANPLDNSRYSNIMYALHFYAATHKDSLRNKLISAYNQGLPIFVSEFSICEASGNGWNDTASAGQWMDLLNSCGISYVAWNLSNKAESSSLLNSSCTKTGGFSYDDFSESGKWYLNQLGN